ncbi:hypothetical protein EUGRSUZ_B00472 [Eucalyptus grandis]|uniref:Uncharacterized protein n=2 Tax=Eucalyptus grandis TaxID=71139 RepID=A0A059CZJ1_EUCGR|nr:hypothetical protein EUGRSUZ_B00472 [Eucalyptus grandis]
MKSVSARCFTAWSRLYGPVMSVWLGSHLSIVMCTPELGQGTRGLYGPHYVKLTRICVQELFSARRIEALRPIREDEVRNMGRSLVIRKCLNSVAYNCISWLVFRKRFMAAGGEATEQGLNFKEIVAERNRREELRRHVARRDRLVQVIIGEHRPKAVQGRAAKQHFLDALLGMQENYDLSEETEVELLWDMITAGMDTVAISVEWAMTELIKNPQAQRKVQELDWANANTKIGHHDIPKGTIVSIDLSAMGRDPDLWQGPLEFWPKRFLKDDVDVKGQDFRLLPFGSGRRVCPAAQLSINLVASMLGQLLHHFSWAGAEEIDMTENAGLVCYMQRPLQAIPTMRRPANLYDRS